MAVLREMPSMQYSARRARLYLIGGTSGPPIDWLIQRKRYLARFNQFYRAHWVTDRQTDWQTTLLGRNNRWHLRT